MRTLLKVTCEVEASNKAILDGTLPKLIQSTMEKIKPEASYFLPENGCRTAMFVFDLKDSSDIPVIGEPFFMLLNARIEFTPVMNAEDLQKGLSALSR
ncbi:MAG TPA: hypothetical protein VM802_15055 [Chitinophaga sp.]|uniref:hypothetical protein n=1 Tax=Chitinophaga sp. TaxID=1869181 RepID=UPI002C606BA0|nr:hypothetical protein [Chitinophaga sp.]HVI46192.1 hypothetical protein [Chitinophaga sp.]